MNKIKHKDELSTFKGVVTFSFASICSMLIAALALLVCYCIRPDWFAADRNSVVEAATDSVASGAEITREAISDRQYGLAIINDAIDEETSAPSELTESETSFLSVVWIEDGELRSADSRQETILITPSCDYSFSLTVKISQATATNVRAFVRAPKVLLSDRPAYIEALVVSDNALPYYTRLTLLLDDSMVEVADEAVGTPISCMLFRYRDDSAVLHSNSLVDGQKLDEYELFTSETGAILGAQAMDGEIPADEAGYCIISWTMQSDTIDATTYSTQHTVAPVAEPTWLKQLYDAEYREQQPKG